MKNQNQKKAQKKRKNRTMESNNLKVMSILHTLEVIENEKELFSKEQKLKILSNMLEELTAMEAYEHCNKIKQIIKNLNE